MSVVRTVTNLAFFAAYRALGHSIGKRSLRDISRAISDALESRSSRGGEAYCRAILKALGASQEQLSVAAGLGYYGLTSPKEIRLILDIMNGRIQFRGESFVVKPTVFLSWIRFRNVAPGPGDKELRLGDRRMEDRYFKVPCNWEP